MSKRKHNRPKPKAKSRRDTRRGPTPRTRRDEPDLLGEVRRALRGSPVELLELAGRLMAITQTSADPFAAEEAEVPSLSQLVDAFLDAGRPETSALLAVWQVLTDDELVKAKIQRELSRRTSPAPGWLASLGDACVRAVTETGHVLGDGDNINLGVRLATGEEMTAVVYVDHNLGTVVKDAFFVPEPIERLQELHTELADDPGVVHRELEPADAKAMLTEALEHGAMLFPPLESDTWPACRPLVQWLLRQLPDGGTGYQHKEWDEPELDAERDRFLASAQASHVRDDPDCVDLADSLFWFGSGWSGTDPLRWSSVRVEVLLLDWLPRKIVADADYLSKAPEVLRALIRWAHAERGIPSELTQETLEAVDELEPDYQRAIRAPRRQGVDALLERMGVLDDELEDPYASFGTSMLAGLARQVGGPDVLESLSVEPLAEVAFDPTDVDPDIRDRVSEVADLLTEVLSDDRELLSACLRFLTAAATGDAGVFRRVSKPANSAAAVGWVVGKANRLFESVTVKEFTARFGVTGSSSQRGDVLLRAAGLFQSTYGEIELPDYLTSARRRQILDLKVRYEQLVKGPDVVRLEVVLRDVLPVVRRTIDVPSDIALPRLHQVLQAALGWENSHLHQFRAGDRRWSVPSPYSDDELAEDERGATLSDLPASFIYEYDFGDSWEHEVSVVGLGDKPGLVEGEGVCPPEDCGGAPGFEHLLAALGDPKHPDHDDMVEWTDGWEPVYDHDFQTAAVTRVLGWPG